MKLNFFGQRNFLGGGVHYSSFVDQFKNTHAVNQNIAEYSFENWQKYAGTTSPDDVNIWFSNNKIIKAYPGFNIIWAIFESDQLPWVYIASLLECANLIWTPSHWAKQILMNHGISPEMIDVVPEGIDPNIYHPFSRNQPTETYRFLTIGKYEQRKGYDQLFEAFSKCFKGNAKVELLIKADWLMSNEISILKKNELHDVLSKLNMPNIKVLNGQFDQSQMPMLYSFADGFVFPTRAEGWGLPLTEAIASGLPCATTDYSGQTEFLAYMQEEFLPIKHSLVPIEDTEFFKYWPRDANRTMQWAQADVDHLCEVMLEMVSKRTPWMEKGKIASDQIRNLFSWRRAVDVALQHLNNRKLLPSPNIVLQV
jgi:glycosyltransferase involved in cell wall biosynthesis